MWKVFLSGLTTEYLMFLDFFFLFYGGEEGDTERGCRVSRDLLRSSTDRASLRCCSKGNSTIICQQAWERSRGEVERGSTLMVMPEKQLLRSSLTAH